MNWTRATTGQSPSCQYLIVSLGNLFITAQNLFWINTIHCTIISMVSGKMLHTACTHWYCQRNPAQYWWRLFSCSIFIDLKNAIDIVNLIAKTRTLRNPWSSKYLVFLLSKWSTSNYSSRHLRILDRVLSLLCATRISPAWDLYCSCCTWMTSLSYLLITPTCFMLIRVSDPSK